MRIPEFHSAPNFLAFRCAPFKLLFLFSCSHTTYLLIFFYLFVCKDDEKLVVLWFSFDVTFQFSCVSATVGIPFTFFFFDRRMTVRFASGCHTFYRVLYKLEKVDWLASIKSSPHLTINKTKACVLCVVRWHRCVLPSA